MRFFVDDYVNVPFTQFTFKIGGNLGEKSLILNDISAIKISNLGGEDRDAGASVAVDS